MANYFYVKTCYEKADGNRKKDKKIRVRVLGGQKLYGNPLDVTLNISCSHSIREDHPIGTIFCCTEMTERESSNGAKFYKVPNNKLYPMEEEGKIICSSDRMVKDYEDALPYMINEERRLKLDWILSDDDLPLFGE